MSESYFLPVFAYVLVALVLLAVGLVNYTSPITKGEERWGARASLLFWVWPVWVVVVLLVWAWRFAVFVGNGAVNAFKVAEFGWRR